MSRTVRNVPHWASTRAARQPGSYRGSKGRWSTYDRVRKGLAGSYKTSWERMETETRKRKERVEGKREAHNWVKTANALFLGAR